jgi:hypothetical protein
MSVAIVRRKECVSNDLFVPELDEVASSQIAVDARVKRPGAEVSQRAEAAVLYCCLLANALAGLLTRSRRAVFLRAHNLTKTEHIQHTPSRVVENARFRKAGIPNELVS